MGAVESEVDSMLVAAPTGAVATEAKVLELPSWPGPVGVLGMLSMRPAVADRVVFTNPGTRCMCLGSDRDAETSMLWRESAPVYTTVDNAGMN